MNKDEPLIDGLPKEYYDDTKELHRRRQQEEEEEERKIEEYREIGTRLKGYPEEDVRKARRLVSSLIRAAEEVEEEIEKAAEKGELNELVLMVIWNRLDLARRDEEKDAIRSLDLLYRRVETQILKREATPAMRLLNDLLNMHDGFDDEGWMKACKKRMVDTFPREDPFSILVPAGFDIDKNDILVILIETSLACTHSRNQEWHQATRTISACRDKRITVLFMKAQSEKL
uniref:Uncharacterized protein n=1 Tax=Quercus lobata TaxID=97700 RepID=A0A7N2MQR2_QUELO